MKKYRELWSRLADNCGEREAQAVVRLVLEERFGLSLGDVLAGGLDALSVSEQADLERIMQRLERGEPVQYALGWASFCGRRFRVEPGVLIPRPETEELCRWIIRNHGAQEGCAFGPECRVLDIGTGSGCIAVTLAAELSRSAKCTVTAWDIAPEALRVARENAESAGVHVSFEQRDVLDSDLNASASGEPTRWHLVVSNPPYVLQREAAGMDTNVLEHEPHKALFVPDDDPLLFYRAIARLAHETLAPGGWLYFEINPLCEAQLAAMLTEMGFAAVEICADQFGKSRFARAMKC